MKAVDQSGHLVGEGRVVRGRKRVPQSGADALQKAAKGGGFEGAQILAGE
ncbi:hypothetical protein MOX02_34370 [Methylobacterium oxalidis]|uniref:Uncharacterized protein n=1 Tax=Methylobacterium oxalidis TaxID=944322 RepID=A0A512J6B1_9HYPH|nr:hypothetical protein MOX02_34370 [Methylobacterium oxalidis]GJE34503.1 hypothetical protein LDDCCGHA_4714 [Methylobacterium oxalidis]GLS66289.1 hypothetical protein GCM10007888_46710 [Methylobacterium oxalidis]